MVVVDNLSNGKKFKKKNLIHLNQNFSSKVIANFIKKKNIKKIIHLAAYIDAEESVNNPIKYSQNNLIEFKKFLENIKNSNLKKLFLHLLLQSMVMDQKKKLMKDLIQNLCHLMGYQNFKVRSYLVLLRKKFFSSYSLRFFNIAGANVDIGCGPFNKSYKHIFNILLKKKYFSLMEIIMTLRMELV